jgi:hypothetical protein
MPDAAPIRAEKFNVFCDESRHTGSHKYVVLGGVWVRDGWEGMIAGTWKDRLKDFSSVPEFVKWTRTPSVSSFVFSAYQRLIDLFFECNRMDSMRFRAVVTKKADFDMTHDGYCHGDYETGFHMLYYQLLSHPCEPGAQYCFNLAERNKGTAPSDGYATTVLLDCLRKSNRQSSIPVIKYVRAQDSLFVQIADILMGAVGYHYEDLHKVPNASPGKIALAAQIAGKLGRKDLIFSSPKSEKKFNVFRFRPNEQKKETPGIPYA